MLFDGGEHDAKRRAAIDLRLKLQSAAMFFDDARRDRQPETRASFLRAEERIEQTLLHIWRNAFAVIFESRE